MNPSSWAWQSSRASSSLPPWAVVIPMHHPESKSAVSGWGGYWELLSCPESSLLILTAFICSMQAAPSINKQASHERAKRKTNTNKAELPFCHQAFCNSINILNNHLGSVEINTIFFFLISQNILRVQMCLLPLCKLGERSEQHYKKKFEIQQERFWTAPEAVDRLSSKDVWSKKRSKENFTKCVVATEDSLKPPLPWRFLDTEGISKDFSSLTLTIAAKSMVCVDVSSGLQLPGVTDYAKSKYLQLCPPALDRPGLHQGMAELAPWDGFCWLLILSQLFLSV